jgi:hypothetical protein
MKAVYLLSNSEWEAGSYGIKEKVRYNGSFGSDV